MEREFVWGLRLPGSFGRHRPDVVFHGWKDDLQEYYENELTDGERANLNRGADQLYFNAVEKWTVTGETLDAFEMPRAFRSQRTYKSLNDVFSTDNRMLAVSEEVKALIEEFEPGVHQFWPIEMVFGDGTVSSRRYFGFSNRQYFRAVIRDHDDGTDAKSEGFENKYPFSKDVFDEAKIWRDKQAGIYSFICSQEVKSEFDNRRLKAQNFYKLWVV